MKYLVVAVENGRLSWNILEYKDQIPGFLEKNYPWILENSTPAELNNIIKVFEIEPNYEIMKLSVIKPVKLSVNVDYFKCNE